MGLLTIGNNIQMYYPDGYDKVDKYGDQLFNDGLYHGVDLIKEGVTFKNSLLIDAGAYVGWFTHWALLQGVSSVLAFEPLAKNFVCLHNNLKKHNWQNTHVFPYALVDTPKILGMHGLGQKSTIIELPSNQSFSDATVGMSIDAFHLDESDPLIIKMDVEGSESLLIKGAANLLSQRVAEKRDTTLIICVYHYTDQCADVKKLIQEYTGNKFSYKEVGSIDNNTALLICGGGVD